MELTDRMKREEMCVPVRENNKVKVKELEIAGAQELRLWRSRRGAGRAPHQGALSPPCSFVAALVGQSTVAQGTLSVVGRGKVLDEGKGR